MKSLAQLVLVMSVIVVSKTTTAQIVNIESARMHTDSLGMMGEINTDFSLIKNSQQIFSADLSAHLQYKTKKDLYLFVGSYGYLKGDGDALIDNTFFHFRYNRKLNKWLRWEAFTQLQKNTINKIDSRFLIGTGPRNKIIERKFIKMYIASLIMYEYQKDKTDPAVIHKDIRNSSYISLVLKPVINLEIVTTTFYQPLYKDIADYRILNQVKIKIIAGKHFGVSLNWSYLFDSMPVVGIPKVSYSLSSGLGYEF